VPSSYLQPANRCFSPTKGSRTNPNGARRVRPSAPRVAGPLRREQKRKRLARSAERKPRCPSGLHRGDRYFAGNASRLEDRWEQLRAKKVFLSPRFRKIKARIDRVSARFSFQQRNRATFDERTEQRGSNLTSYNWNLAIPRDERGTRACWRGRSRNECGWADRKPYQEATERPIVEPQSCRNRRRPLQA
jgi:hypothetical protein